MIRVLRAACSTRSDLTWSAVTYCHCLGGEVLTHLRRAQFRRHIHERRAPSNYSQIISDGEANQIIDTICSLCAIHLFNVSSTFPSLMSSCRIRWHF